MFHRQDHIRDHVRNCETAHQKLKDVLKKDHSGKEKILPVFLITFVLVFLTLLIFRSWDNIVSVLNPEGETHQIQTIYTHGAKTGVLSVMKIEDQASRDDRHLLASVLTAGSTLGAQVNGVFGSGRGQALPNFNTQLKNTVWVTNYLSQGQHLTALNQSQARALQKSVLSTYYLGEKTIDINSTLQTDAEILGKIRSTLSVDLFAYLNQAPQRSDALDEYIFLLENLLSKADQRINDLQYKIDFLNSNSQLKAVEITTSEQSFFDNLEIFDGKEAERELGEFIGLQESQAEIRAKLGAYNSLQGYYKFFKPRIENLIKAIKANRSALVAGVKVVEIQNMTLPLIIREN